MSFFDFIPPLVDDVFERISDISSGVLSELIRSELFADGVVEPVRADNGPGSFTDDADAADVSILLLVVSDMARKPIARRNLSPPLPLCDTCFDEEEDGL